MLAPLLLLTLMQVPTHVAVTPSHRLTEEWWAQRHARCVQMTKDGGIDVAFLGDSITQGWEGAGAPAWRQYYAPRKAANFGFSGDRTEHVLWRLENGELIAAKPKVVVIMIGTNNVGHGSSTPQMAADGVRAIVAKLLKETDSKILLIGIFPRDEQPDGRLRLAVNEATKGFAPLHDGKRVFFEDIGRFFLHQDGTLRTMLMPDRLHLETGGYEVWAKAMERTLARLLAMG